MIRKIKAFKARIGRFISIKVHKTKLGVSGFINERALPTKTWEFTKYLISGMFTGIIIYYTLTHFNWISMGLASMLIPYYVEWFVRLIKEKGSNE